MEMESLMEKVDSEWKTIHSLFPKVVSEIIRLVRYVA